MKTIELNKDTDLQYEINDNNLYISISSLLSKEDYDAVWAGENGADGYYTDNVTKIRDAVSPFANEFGPDLQIWEDGNAFIQNLDPSKLDKVVEAIKNI